MRIFTLFLLTFSILFADNDFAKPLPSFDQPRKIMFVIMEQDEESIQHVLSVANNVLKGYGPENVELRVVAYSKGIRSLLKSEKAFKGRVETLMQYDVTFLACGNTMRTKKIKESELIEGVEVVSVGIIEVVERVKEGFIYIRP